MNRNSKDGIISASISLNDRIPHPRDIHPVMSVRNDIIGNSDMMTETRVKCNPSIRPVVLTIPYMETREIDPISPDGNN